MKTFKEFINESSLTRLKSKSDKGGMAVLSGSRGDKSAKENRARAKQLDKDIRGKGLPGATKVTGRYDEKDDKTGKVTKVKERSHVVTSGKMGKRKFKKAVKALGKKYDQDAVITQTKGGGGATPKRTRKGALPKRNIKIGKMRPGRTGEMDTRIKGKTFTYESYLRIQERGKTYSMVISWRGKLINSQMFFPSFKRPTKAEITAEVQKVYPTAIVMYFSPAMRDPTQPMLFGGQEKKVKERSHVVTSGKMGKRKFKKAVKALGKKYDQDAVITQTKGGGGATLKRTRKGALPKRNIPIGKMRPGRTGEMDTRIKGKTFTYESYLRIQERGKTYSMVISWRGKLINSQMFFPSFKRPTKAEITAEVQKVYPTAIVMYFNPAMRDPTQPMLFGGQET